MDERLSFMDKLLLHNIRHQSLQWYTLLSIAFGLGQSSVVVAQHWHEVERMALDCRSFQVDALENIYALHDEYIEVTRHQDGLKYRSSFLEYGPNYTLDLTNPLKPFLFYPDQGIALFLDNMLSFQGETIRWQEMGFEQVEWMAGSRGDHFWLWDGLANELLRVNKQMQIQQRTGDLSSRLGKRLRPIQIIECTDDVCLVTEVGEVIVLDLFGAYRSSFHIAAGSRLIGFAGSVVAWQEGEEIHALDLLTWGEEVMKDLPAGCDFKQWQSAKWYGHCGESLVTYQRNVP